MNNYIKMRIVVGLLLITFFFWIYIFSPSNIPFSPSLKCWGGGAGCWDGLVVGTMVLIFFFPAKIFLKNVYNFIYNKLPKQVLPNNVLSITSTTNSNTLLQTIRSLFAIGITIAIPIILWITYNIYQDYQSAKSTRAWNTIESTCVNEVMLTTTDSQICTNENYTLHGVCTRVDISRSHEEGGQATYYVDKKLYEDCLRNSPATDI